MIFAVLPAAGKSTRMGQPKLALPLGQRTILEHVLTALRQAEVEHIVVVLGPHVRELAALAEGAGAHVCQLTQDTAGMRETVEHGLRWLEDRFQPRLDDAWLLVPGDHPTLSAGVMGALRAAWQVHREYSIYVPTYQGRRGHPLLLTWRHVAGIRAHPIGEGLNRYVRQRLTETLEVPVSDPNVLSDLDTPEEYARLQRSWQV
jgi:molybdenum cofactor cytidylyltransferase